MLSYVIRRLLYSIVVLVATSLLVFTFVSVSGDPLAALRVTPNYDPSDRSERIERAEATSTSRSPCATCYWVKDAVTNQFGTTLLGDRPILPDLWRVMKNTLQLVFIAELLAILDRRRDRGLLRLTPVLGVRLLGDDVQLLRPCHARLLARADAPGARWCSVYESTGHRLFPISSLSSVDPGTGIDFWIDRAHHLVLPVIVLMVASIATYSRYMRASMLEVINSDYVRTARAKGLDERRVTMKHAFRNALIPLVTLVALNFGALLGGAIVTETVFSLDGMGLYFVNAL